MISLQHMLPTTQQSWETWSPSIRKSSIELVFWSQCKQIRTLLYVIIFLTQDNNMGLVKQCVTSMYKKNIQRLTKVCAEIPHTPPSAPIFLNWGSVSLQHHYVMLLHILLFRPSWPFPWLTWPTEFNWPGQEKLRNMCCTWWFSFFHLVEISLRVL